MYKIDNSTAVSIMPAAGSPGPKVNGYFVTNTFLSQAWINAFQDEICNVITGAGNTLSKGDYTQLYNSILELITSAGPYPYIEAVEDDPNPTLGGNLNTGAFFINNGSNPVVINPNGTGDIRLNAAILQLERLAHKGDTDTYIDIQDASITARCGGVSIFDVTTAGVRFGSGARANGMSGLSGSTLLNQQAARGLVDSFGSGNTNAGGPSTDVLITFIRMQTAASAKTFRGWQVNGAYSENGNTQDNNQYIVKQGGTISRLTTGSAWREFVGGDQNTDIPTSIVVTLQINNADTAVTVTIGRLIGNQTWTESLLSPITVVSGDKLRFKAVTNGAVVGSNVSTFHLALSIRR